MSLEEFRSILERRYRFTGSVGPLRLYLRRS
jgi:hypothetical protein